MSEANEFRPVVPAEEYPPEITLRAIVLGALVGIVFGAASTYLALMVGLTVSASVPAAVMAIAILWRRRGQRAILEHNVAQTVASAGESVASALVFTVPALIFLGFPLDVSRPTLIALTGGCLGVLLMVPLRRYLIVREHGKLRYPEGRACAEILSAGERGGNSAIRVFLGIFIGAGAKTFQTILGGVKTTVGAIVPYPRGSVVACDVEPPLFGVGYVIGYRTSVLMVAGSVLASFVLIPLVKFFGETNPGVLAPGLVPIAEMSPGDIWDSYVRYIGAGAVAAGGVFGLIKALPAIVSSLFSSLRGVFGGSSATSTLRTDRDVPMSVLVIGSIAIVALIWAVPIFEMNLIGALLILVLGFVFAVVSSRITGEVGSTSCPLSGMTIAVLMATCGAFLYQGWEGPVYAKLAIIVGAVVCIAISNAGTCSQDLKTGFLVGATPRSQQFALLVGVLLSVPAVGWTAYLLNETHASETPVARAFTVPSESLAIAENRVGKDKQEYAFVRVPPGENFAPPGNYLVDRSTGNAVFERHDGIGSDKFPAPQAGLMAVIVDGLMNRKLPWDLILLGVALAAFIELLGFGSLTFAVGVYLPLSSTMPVFLGGLARKIADRIYHREPDAEDEPHGVLFSSGLIAGAALVGIGSACLAFLDGYDADRGLHPKFAIFMNETFASSDRTALLVIAALTLVLVVAARGRRAPPSVPVEGHS